jgi:zinc transport system substrate-binding protein
MKPSRILPAFVFSTALVPVLLLALCLPGLTGCRPPSEKGKKYVSVSILPEKYFVDRITGGDYEVNVLLPAGASHDSYEPTPAQMKKLAASDIFFKMGYLAFEQTWMDRFLSGYPGLKIVNLSSGIDLITGEDHHDHGDTRGIDPHTWMSPRCAGKMAAAIWEALSAVDPANKTKYRKNYDSFCAGIDSLDNYISTSLAGLSTREILIFHPALAYFARDYSLTQIAVEVEGKNPSPAHLAEIINTARDKGIKIIFIQKEFDAENARIIAREIDGKVVPIDPMTYKWKEQLIEITRLVNECNSN